MRSILIAVLIAVSTFAEARLPDLIPYRMGKLWGYCDSTKKIMIAPQWDWVGFFDANTAVVRTGGLEGLIDRTGKYVVFPRYGWIEPQERHGLRQVSRMEYGERGAINAKGEIVIPLKYEWLVWRGPYLEGMRGKGKCGVFDSLGREVLPFIYENRGDFPESMGDSGQFAMKKNGYWGVVDTSGKIIIPFKYYWISATNCGIWEVRTDYSEYTFYDTRGNYISDANTCPPAAPWPGYHELVNGMQSFKEGNLIGYKDASGNVIYEPQFGVGYDFQANGIAEVWAKAPSTERGASVGYIDIHGNKYWED